jgi:hypothetical protein
MAKETTNASLYREDDHKIDQPSHQPSQAMTLDNDHDSEPKLQPKVTIRPRNNKNSSKKRYLVIAKDADDTAAFWKIRLFGETSE